MRKISEILCAIRYLIVSKENAGVVSRVYTRLNSWKAKTEGRKVYFEKPNWQMQTLLWYMSLGPYAQENMTAEEFEQYRKKAKQILGYMPMQKTCLTCYTPDEERPKGTKLPPRNCLARHCVPRMGIENCAYCSRFPCDFIKEHSGQWNRKYFEEKHGKPISDEDYITFIEPFEGFKRLEAIRATLKPEDIVEATKVPPLKREIVDFPDLPFSKEETLALRGFTTCSRVLSVHRWG